MQNTRPVDPRLRAIAIALADELQLDPKYIKATEYGSLLVFTEEAVVAEIVKDGCGGKIDLLIQASCSGNP